MIPKLLALSLAVIITISIPGAYCAPPRKSPKLPDIYSPDRSKSYCTAAIRFEGLFSNYYIELNFPGWEEGCNDASVKAIADQCHIPGERLVAPFDTPAFAYAQGSCTMIVHAVQMAVKEGEEPNGFDFGCVKQAVECLVPEQSRPQNCVRFLLLSSVISWRRTLP